MSGIGLVEMTCVADFRDCVRNGLPLVIQDGARPEPVMHRSSCPWVKETSFVEKVVVNGGKTGRYYRVASPADAMATVGARSCRHCGGPMN